MFQFIKDAKAYFLGNLGVYVTLYGEFGWYSKNLLEKLIESNIAKIISDQFLNL